MSASRLSRKKGPSCRVLVIEFQFFERGYISYSPEAANSGLVIKHNVSLLYVCIFEAVVNEASQTSNFWVTFTYLGRSVDQSPPGTFHLEQRSFKNTYKSPPFVTKTEHNSTRYGKLHIQQHTCTEKS